jgi:hypothetical protein
MHTPNYDPQFNQWLFIATQLDPRRPAAHGCKSRVDESSQNLQWGDANTGCPPDFYHFSKFQALAMDSSPLPPDFNPDLRYDKKPFNKTDKRNLSTIKTLKTKKGSYWKATAAGVYYRDIV